MPKGHRRDRSSRRQAGDPARACHTSGFIAGCNVQLPRSPGEELELSEGSAFAVGLCTNRREPSWTGAVSFFDHSRCDFLFVWLIDGRRWFIPSTAVDGKRGISLGGPKYAEYEIRADGEVPEASSQPPTMPVPERGERRSRRDGRACKVRAFA